MKLRRLATPLVLLSCLLTACLEPPDDGVEESTLLGPPLVGSNPGWTPTETYTPGQGFAMIDVNGKLHSFVRNPDGLLGVAPNLTGSVGLTSVPRVSAAGHIAAAYDPGVQRVFVTYVDEFGQLVVAQSSLGPSGALSTWTYAAPITSVEAMPAIAIGCGRVVVTFARTGSIYAMYRATAATATTPWTFPLSPLFVARSGARPAMAANSRGDVAVFAPGDGVGVQSSTAMCTGPSDPTWQSLRIGTSRQAGDLRVGAVAYGPIFAIALRGTDGHGYYLSQTLDGWRRPTWIDAYDKITAAPLTGEPALRESPVLFNYRGAIVAAARDQSNQLYYWIRNPNTLLRLSSVPAWAGGKIVGGAGTSATLPAMASTGRLDRTGWSNAQYGVPSELYLTTRGINDQQIYATNLGRGAALDIVGTQYKVRWDTAFQLSGIATQDVPNLPEHLLSFLSSPSKSWKDQAQPTFCNTTTQVTFIPDSEREWAFSTCGNAWEPLLKLNGNNGSRALIWQEWHHFSQSGSSTLKGLDTYKALFNDPLPRLCTTSADCGGATCDLASKVPYLLERVNAVYGNNVNVCISEWGRALGFEWGYDFTSEEHAFGDVAYMYRFFGDKLRRHIKTDADFGDDLLYRKYQFIREIYYGGVEFNGDESMSLVAATGDETRGGYAMPVSNTPVPGVDITVHLSDLGDKVVHQWFGDAEYAGTRNEGRRLEGFSIAFHPPVPNLGLRYTGYLQGGVTSTVDAPQFLGTRGQSRRLEAFNLQLTGSAASRYDVYYSCNIEGQGDGPYVANGTWCGIRGAGQRIEGITVRIMPRSLTPRSAP